MIVVDFVIFRHDKTRRIIFLRCANNFWHRRLWYMPWTIVNTYVLEGGISCSYQCGKFLMCEHQIMSVFKFFFFLLGEKFSRTYTELFCYHNKFCYVFTTTSRIQVHFNNTKCDIVELRHVKSVTFYFPCLLGITRTWTITKILLVGRVCFERTATFFYTRPAFMWSSLVILIKKWIKS